MTLAMHTQRIDNRLDAIESRIDACENLASTVPDAFDLPSQDDLLDVRVHSARVAAEVSRLTVNMYSRIDDLAVQHRAALAALERERADLRSSVVDLSGAMDTTHLDLRQPPGDWAATA